MAVENEPCHLKWEAGQAMPSDPQGGAWDDEGMGGVALCAFFRSLKSHLNSFQLNLRLSIIMALLRFGELRWPILSTFKSMFYHQRSTWR